MSDHGYEVFGDPYCYTGAFVLKNKLGLRDPAKLEAFELEMSSLRAEEALPIGRFGPTHYRALHRHLFCDVYTWAGRYRTVRTAKGGNAFCYPEHIAAQMDKLFARLQLTPFKGGSSAVSFVPGATAFLAELNAIHPFRDGNGRAQLSFMHSLSIRAGHPFEMSLIKPTLFLQAMIQSFGGNFDLLERELRRLL